MATTKDQYVARLRAVPLFAGLSKRELELLLRQAEHLRYPARFRVVREGAKGEEFWMVVEGELTVHRGGEDVARIGPGDFFGELSVIDPAPRNATIVSETPVELLVIGRRKFWASIENSPRLMQKVVTALARRVRERDAAAPARAAATPRAATDVTGDGTAGRL